MTTKKSPTTCPSCGSTVAQHSGKGRPSVYCSTTCRRTAEAAIRRLQIHLTRCEKAEQQARLALALPADTWPRVDRAAAEAKAQFYRNEIDRLTGELRGLLADGDGNTAASPMR